MTSLVQVAMVGECRRTSDCARCMQRGVDACYAPSRSCGKCAFSSHTLIFAEFFFSSQGLTTSPGSNICLAK